MLDRFTSSNVLNGKVLDLLQTKHPRLNGLLPKNYSHDAKAILRLVFGHTLSLIPLLVLLRRFTMRLNKDRSLHLGVGWINP